ncbi:MAG TPA: hypothetical protein VG984_01505 [Candidatus Paceibacterota bacterium]|nr:hypothetical protein [Candidatus Paceibacterota bacterium]
MNKTKKTKSRVAPKKAVKVIVKKPSLAEVSTTPRPNMQLQGPHKTFQQDGHWIEKPNKTAILICICGNRYLKTRPKQEKCLRCVSATMTLRR